MVATILGELRTIASPGALRERYCAHDGERVRAVAERCGLGEEHLADLRRLEDAAHGLRWLELACGLHLDPHRSLMPQVHASLIGAALSGAVEPEPANVSPAPE